MLLGFKKRFKQNIENGSKIHTVRAFRKVQPKLGETLHMYTGLRTKNCDLITNKEKLKGIQDVAIIINEDWSGEPKISCRIHVDDKTLSEKQMNEFAFNDGFVDLEDFMLYWLDGNPEVKFIGNIFHWTDFKY